MTLTTLTTRDKLIEVARQLFARKGVENTTMLDIANASDRGRRTIYTYFRNKREIHQAVIEKESDIMVSDQRAIAATDAPAAEKLRDFLRVSLKILGEPREKGLYHESKSLLMWASVRRSEKARKLAARKQIEILRGIISQGVDSGEFDPGQASRVMPLVITVLHGVTSPYLPTLLGEISPGRADLHESVIDFIVSGITK